MSNSWAFINNGGNDSPYKYIGTEAHMRTIETGYRHDVKKKYQEGRSAGYNAGYNDATAEANQNIAHFRNLADTNANIANHNYDLLQDALERIKELEAERNEIVNRWNMVMTFSIGMRSSIEEMSRQKTIDLKAFQQHFWTFFSKVERDLIEGEAFDGPLLKGSKSSQELKHNAFKEPQRLWRFLEWMERLRVSYNKQPSSPKP